MRITKILCLFFFIQTSFGQDNPKDSLVKVLEETTDNDEIIAVISQLISNSNTINEFDLWANKAQPFLNISQNDSLKTAFKLNEGRSRIENQDNLKGMEILLAVIEDASKIGDSLSVAKCNYCIGRYYFYEEEFELGLKYMQESVDLHPKSGNQLAKANYLMALGVMYHNINELESALKYQIEALEIKKSMNAWNGVPVSLNNIAETYESLGDIDKAFEIVEQSLQISDSLDIKPSYYYAYFLKGYFLEKTGEYAASIPYLETAIIWWENENKTLDLLTSYAAILISYKNLNRKDDIIITLEKLMALKDKMFDSEKSNAAKEIESKYNSEKKELELQKEKEEREWAQTETELTKQSERKNLIIFTIVALFLMVSIFYFYIRYKNQQRDKNIILEQKSQLEARSQEIHDSIVYAKRLQTAIMPTAKTIQNSFADSFIFYQPKDIVAGDFYWIEEENNIIYVATADCTGHGVPGAMVSVVCTNGLNNALKVHGFTEPADILNKTRELVISQFAKSDENVRDGMDIGLCSIHKNKIKFSGANNPLWIVRKVSNLTEKEKMESGEFIYGEYALIEHKSDKQPVGLSIQNKPFSQIEIDVIEHDKFYLLSDGYADQFGGANKGITRPEGKKYKASQLKNLLLKYADLDFESQYKIIAKEFEDWKGDMEQLDDVCVLGFSL